MNVNCTFERTYTCVQVASYYLFILLVRQTLGKEKRNPFLNA